LASRIFESHLVRQGSRLLGAFPGWKAGIKPVTKEYTLLFRVRLIECQKLIQDGRQPLKVAGIRLGWKEGVYIFAGSRIEWGSRV